MPKNYSLRKRILVTGGAGFLGSHLCERLLSLGFEVICVDNFYTGGKENISHLIGNPRFELIRHDVTFPLYLEVDEIYNLACPASPIHYQYDPVQTTKTSIHGAINMLGLLPSGPEQKSSRHPPVKSMEIRPNTHNRKAIGEMSIPSDSVLVTTKASVVRKLYSSTTTVNTIPTLGWPEYSTHMDLACILTMEG